MSLLFSSSHCVAGEAPAERFVEDSGWRCQGGTRHGGDYVGVVALNASVAPRHELQTSVRSALLVRMSTRRAISTSRGGRPILPTRQAVQWDAEAISASTSARPSSWSLIAVSNNRDDKAVPSDSQPADSGDLAA